MCVVCVLWTCVTVCWVCSICVCGMWSVCVVCPSVCRSMRYVCVWYVVYPSVRVCVGLWRCSVWVSVLGECGGVPCVSTPVGLKLNFVAADDLPASASWVLRLRVESSAPPGWGCGGGGACRPRDMAQGLRAPSVLQFPAPPSSSQLWSSSNRIQHPMQAKYQCT